MEKDIIDREVAFHDEWASSVDPASVNVHALKDACTMPETRYILRHIDSQGGLNGRRILEIGCGCGEASAYFATQGAYVTATDISLGMVELAKKVAEYNNVSIVGEVCSADNLSFAKNSFDIVYAANVLHHVDINKTLDEIRRVLKPEGLFICWDPIQYNPAINIYRRIASGVRTIYERPVDKKYINSIKSRFGQCIYRGFWINTCLIFVKYYFIDKVDPNAERYWKKIIDEADNLKPMYSRLEKIDNIVLKAFPFMKWMCWNMVVISKKEM